jgi:aryl-phospho-beta-D-glucosidase BglC (GH1 family)
MTTNDRTSGLFSAAFLAAVFLFPVRGHADPPAGFVRASGTLIVDGTGNDLRLRGVNLGGWLLWESYLLKWEGPDLTESRMKRAAVKVAGKDAAYSFFRAWRANHTTAADIRRIRELGFNVVRIPFNSRILRSEKFFDMEPGEGWRLLDSALEWCEREGVYAVIDMHSVPGGANPGGITDEVLFPGMWEGGSTTRYRDETASLWREIAARYKDRTIVAAYDLMNEPVLGKVSGAELVDAYRRIVKAVREVDTNHMVMIEGNWYASDFGMFTKPNLDSNLCYQFHRYWTDTAPWAIGYLLDLRKNLEAPIWLGETGENSRQWYARCIETMEEKEIGWCFWPWKRFGGGCVTGMRMPDAWEKVRTRMSRTDSGGAGPDEVGAGLRGLAEASKMENCEEDKEVVDALWGRRFDVFRVPGKIPVVDFARTAIRGKGNAGWGYRGGDADIYGDDKKGYTIRGLEKGDSLEYEVDAAGEDLMRPVLVDAKGEFTVLLDGVEMPKNGGRIKAGRHAVRVRSDRDGGEFSAIEFAVAPPGRVEAEDFLSGEGKGYHDGEPANQGKVDYRKGEGVDVQKSGEGGFAVGWITDGEWMTYAIEVPKPGKYDLVIRHASLDGGGPIKISIDGKKVVEVPVPKTGWWDSWADLAVRGLALPKGKHILRLDAVGGGFNLDYLLFIPAR